MTIEIQRPELAELIQRQMSSGRFHDVEDVLLHALRSGAAGVEEVTQTSAPEAFDFGRKLIEVCAMVKGLTVDVDFSREDTLDRTLDLA